MIVARCMALSMSWLLLSSVSAQIKKTDAGLLPLDKAVRTGQLSNGFTYYLRHNEEPKNKVVMYLVTKAGSILETDDQQGLAHFMEHMSFNGTKHFPKGQLVDYLERSGVRFGADLNAYTSYDETVYQLPLPTDKPGVVDNGIQIMRDWAHEATLDPGEIDAERGVVLEEKRLGKGAGERMRAQYFPVMLNGSRYARRLPIGIDSVLNNFRPETIRRFYHDWYRPDLQALIVVGDIDVNQLEQTVKVKFGDLKNPVNEKPRTRYTIPTNGKNHFMVVTDKEATSTGMQLFYLHKAPFLHTVADYRNMLIRNLFNQMMSFRIQELSMRTDRPFLDAGVSISGFMGGLDYLSVTVGAKQGALEEGVLPVLREVERVRRYGFTASELQRAQQRMLSQMESGLHEKGKTPSQSFVNEYVQYFLKGEASPGIDKEVELTRAFLKDITLTDFIALVKEYMPATNRNILITAPEKEKADLPDEAKAMGWLASIQREELQSYQDGMDGKSLFSTQPVAGRIIDEQKDTVLNTTTLTLSNGVKVVLKATDFRNNEIAFTGYSEGGTSLYSDADYQSAANAVYAMTSGGVGNLDKIQLGKYLTGKQASAFPFMNERYQGFRGSAEPKDLATALQLVYAYSTQPRVNAGLFKTNLDNVRSNLANRANDPGTVFQDTMAAVLSNYNVRRMSVTPEKLDQINFDRAVAIARERFSDASGLTFVLVGNINIDSIRPLLEQYLGSLPATHKNEKAVDLNIHIPEGHIEKTMYRGVEPRATVKLVFSGPYRIGLENNLNMGALKEVLQIRMIQRLRESESGVYSPGVNAAMTKYPETWSMTISFECGPQNVEKLIAAAQEEIDKIKASGPSQVNIDKFKAEDKEVLKGELKSNEYWMGYLSRHLQYKDDLFQILSYDKVIEKVTAASVQAAANEYLNGKNYIRLVLMPENAEKK